MKIFIQSVVSYLLVIVIINSCYADETNVNIRYRWTPLNRYTYNMCNVEMGRTQVVADLSIDVINFSNGTWIISVQYPEIDSSCMLFAKVNEQGVVTDRKYSFNIVTNASNTTYSARLPDAFRSSYALSMTKWLPSTIWEVPAVNCLSSSIEKTELSKVCPTIIVSNSTVTIKEEDVKKNGRVTITNCMVRIYNLNSGTLLEVRERTSNEETILRLEGMTAIGQSIISNRLQLYKNSYDENEFLLLMCSLGIQLKTKTELKNSLFALRDVRDQAVLPSVYEKLSNSANGDLELENMAEDFLFRRSLIGEEWAVRFLLGAGTKGFSEMRLIIRESNIDRFKQLSGLDFGNDIDKWISWVTNIRKEFPKFYDSPEERIRQLISHPVAEVRLYAISLSCEKNLNQSRSILQDALKDDDERIRLFAAKKIKIIDKYEKHKARKNDLLLKVQQSGSPSR
jgi:hypothetical protein